MESNRNLSSIISRIRDEGPPGNDAAPPAETGGAGTVEPPLPAPEVTGQRTSRRLLPGLVLPLFLIIGLVLLAGTYTGYREGGMLAGISSSVRGWFGTAPAAGGVAGDEPDVVDRELVLSLLREQRDIVARLDRLTESVSALGESVSRNSAAGDAAIAGLRQDQQANLEALETRVAALQKQLDGLAVKPAASAASAAKAAPVARAATPSGNAGSTGAAPGDTAAAKMPPQPAIAPVQKAAGSADAAIGEEWVVNVASSSHEAAMVELAAKLKAKGIDVERQTLTIDGDLMYRLRVPGFASSGEARGYAEKLGKIHGLRGAWISRR